MLDTLEELKIEQIFFLFIGFSNIKIDTYPDKQQLVLDWLA